MVDLAADDSPVPVGRVEAISFGQEMFQRPVKGRKDLSDRAIPSLQHSCWRSAMRPLTPVVNPAGPIFATHLCSKIRQVKPCARNSHSERVTRVQTKKPNARLFTAGYVGTNIQFWECGEPQHRWRPTQAHTGHAKRDHREPGLPLKRVDLQLRRNQVAQDCGIDRPVCEEQVMPALRHHPRPFRKRPGPVSDFLQNRAH